MEIITMPTSSSLLQPNSSNKADKRIYGAFVVFGLGSWILANSLFVEVSALYTRVPEGKDFSSDMLVAMQASNFFPIVYMIWNENQRYISTQRTIWLILSAGIVLSTLQACFWDVTFGMSHSIMLLLLVFLSGFVGALSSILFYGFVSAFPIIYTSALATGEGCSGIIAGALGLGQDSGNTSLNFTISTFFFIPAIVFTASMAAFYILTNTAAAKELYEESKLYSALERSPLLRSIKGKKEEVSVKALWKVLIKPFIVQIWICALSYGVVPSIMPFFCGKYKYSSEMLKWSSVLSMASDPVARFITTYYPVYRIVPMAAWLTLVVLVITHQSLWTNSPLAVSSLYGGIFAVALNVVFTFSFAFTQTMVFYTIKSTVAASKHNKTYTQAAYEWSGLLTQLGGMVGSVLIFFMLPR